jgi:hypothetical protein
MTTAGRRELCHLRPNGPSAAYSDEVQSTSSREDQSVTPVPQGRRRQQGRNRNVAESKPLWTHPTHRTGISPVGSLRASRRFLHANSGRNPAGSDHYRRRTLPVGSSRPAVGSRPPPLRWRHYENLRRGARPIKGGGKKQQGGAGLVADPAPLFRLPGRSRRRAR